MGKRDPKHQLTPTLLVDIIDARQEIEHLAIKTGLWLFKRERLAGLYSSHNQRTGRGALANMNTPTGRRVEVQGRGLSEFWDDNEETIIDLEIASVAITTTNYETVQCIFINTVAWTLHVFVILKRHNGELEPMLVSVAVDIGNEVVASELLGHETSKAAVRDEKWLVHSDVSIEAFAERYCCGI